MLVCIQETTCIGCGVCAAFCPQVFRMEGDKAKVIVPAVPPELENLTHATVDVCPVEAIRVVEAEG